MKRLEDESYDDYCLRRREDKALLKQKLGGKFIWLSKNKHSTEKSYNRGTYTKQNG